MNLFAQIFGGNFGNKYKQKDIFHSKEFPTVEYEVLGQQDKPVEKQKVEVQDKDILGKNQKLSRKERDRLEFIDALNNSGYSREIKSVMYAAAEYESGGTFDIGTVERLDPGVTRKPGIGFFQKTGETRDSYEEYLSDNEYDNTPTYEANYYIDAFKDPYGKVGDYLGSGYMEDYNAFNEGKPSEFRSHKGSGIKKIYEPTLEGINEHFTNFMMNPREKDRIASMPRRLALAKKAYETIFTD
jgi:hypothetical protein